LIEGIARKFSGVDASRMFSEKNLRDCRRNLVQAGMRVGPREWLSFSLFAAAFLGLVAAIAGITAYAAKVAAVLSLLVFAASLLTLTRYPSYAKLKRAELVERDMPIALGAIAVDLQANTAFEKAIARVAKGDYGEAGRELGRALRDVEEGGESVQEAMRRAAEHVDSLLVKRAYMQLAFAYEHGASGAEGLRRLADEMIGLQAAKARQYSARMTFFGLLFVSVSCILPAFFSAYAIVGSAFMQLTLSPNDILLAFCVLFPLMDLAILLYLREKTPRILLGGK